MDLELEAMTDEELKAGIRLFESNIRAMKSEISQVTFQEDKENKQAKENQAKVKLFKILPYLVGSVVEPRVMGRGLGISTLAVFLIGMIIGCIINLTAAFCQIWLATSLL